MKKIFFVFALLILLALPMARAAQPGAATTTATSKGNYTYTSTGHVQVVSGNIYSNNLDATQGTYKWVGMYGNVTGTIVLEDTNGKQFFNWTGAKGLLVYASNATADWASLSNATASEVTTAYPFLASGTDDYANTFNAGSKIIGSQIYPSINASYATPFPTGSGFETYALKDNSNNIVWGGKVLSTAASTYDGSTADFEMLLPEDGTSNDNTATTYNFWVELN